MYKIKLYIEEAFNLTSTNNIVKLKSKLHMNYGRKFKLGLVSVFPNHGSTAGEKSTVTASKQHTNLIKQMLYTEGFIWT